MQCFFTPSGRSCRFFFSPGKGEGRGEGFSTILPVVHADGNNLRQAISTQEKPCVVRIALRQIVQGVADGRCGFTDNIRPRDRLRKYWDQIRQNFSSYKLEERQAIYLGVLQDLIPPIITYRVLCAPTTESWFHTCVTSPWFTLSCARTKLDSTYFASYTIH